MSGGCLQRKYEEPALFSEVDLAGVLGGVLVISTGFSGGQATAIKQGGKVQRVEDDETILLFHNEKGAGGFLRLFRVQTIGGHPM